MEKEIQFGICKCFLTLFFFLLIQKLFAQDYFIDSKGKKHDVAITYWAINQFYYTENGKEKTAFTDQIKEIYRAQSQVKYVPYSSIVEKQDYTDFFIPLQKSLYDLSIDCFKDEHFTVWLTDKYLVYKVENPKYTTTSFYLNAPFKSNQQFLNRLLFPQSTKAVLQNIQRDIIFLHHDSVGFTKIYDKHIATDFFHLKLSRYTFNQDLNNSIFNGIVSVKPKQFLNFFNNNISSITEINYKDKDLAAYEIINLKEKGALVVLLNLDKKKIKLYREGGNEKLANTLEENLKKENLNLARAFLDSTIFNFTKVYLIDSKYKKELLNGIRKGIFLDNNLEVDSNIYLNEKYILFAKEGQVYETQALYPSEGIIKKTVTATPVVQDALVICDKDLTQLLDPFPCYVRKATAKSVVGSNKLSKKSKRFEDNDVRNVEIVEAIAKKLSNRYGEGKVSKPIIYSVYALSNILQKFYIRQKYLHKRKNWDYKWGSNSTFYKLGWKRSELPFYMNQNNTR